MQPSKPWPEAIVVKKHPDGLYVRGNTAMQGVVPVWRLATLPRLDRFVAAKADRERVRRDFGGGIVTGTVQLEPNHPDCP